MKIHGFSSFLAKFPAISRVNFPVNFRFSRSLDTQ